MRFYPLLDFQTVLMAILLGLIAVVVLLIAFGTYRRPRTGEADPDGMEEYPEGIRAADNPVPPLIVLVLLGLIGWVIAYLWVVGIQGPPF